MAPTINPVPSSAWAARISDRSTTGSHPAVRNRSLAIASRAGRRSLKYEEVYLKAYTDGHEARAGIRPHQALVGRTPIAVWRAGSGLGETAVDMTLPPAAASLDDAFASPTCPPRPPQQQPLEAA